MFLLYGTPVVLNMDCVFCPNQTMPFTQAFPSIVKLFPVNIWPWTPTPPATINAPGIYCIKYICLTCDGRLLSSFYKYITDNIQIATHINITIYSNNRSKGKISKEEAPASLIGKYWEKPSKKITTARRRQSSGGNNTRKQFVWNFTLRFICDN